MIIAILIAIATIIVAFSTLVVITYLKNFRWYRKMKGGTWTKVWWNKYDQGGHICWISRKVENSPYSKVLEMEDYRV